MNMMYKKGLFLRALCLSLRLLFLPFSRGRTMSRRDLYMYIACSSSSFFSFHFLNLYHSFVLVFHLCFFCWCWLFVCWPELNQYTAHVRSALTSTIPFRFERVCVSLCVCIYVSILYVMVFGFSPDFIQIVYNVVGSLVLYTERVGDDDGNGNGVDTITIIHLVVLHSLLACLPCVVLYVFCARFKWTILYKCVRIIWARVWIIFAHSLCIYHSVSPLTRRCHSLSCSLSITFYLYVCVSFVK